MANDLDLWHNSREACTAKAMPSCGAADRQKAVAPVCVRALLKYCLTIKLGCMERRCRFPSLLAPPSMDVVCSRSCACQRAGDVSATMLKPACWQEWPPPMEVIVAAFAFSWSQCCFAALLHSFRKCESFLIRLISETFDTLRAFSLPWSRQFPLSRGFKPVGPL